MSALKSFGREVQVRCIFLLLCFIDSFRQIKSGWINNDEFREIIMNTLIPEINRKRSRGMNEKRALLLLDGHSTRLQKGIWEQMKENNVDVLCIPAHTSNFTQPLDQTVNAQFKRGKVVYRWPLYPPHF
jgi:hypothetical protein